MFKIKQKYHENSQNAVLNTSDIYKHYWFLEKDTVDFKFTICVKNGLFSEARYESMIFIIGSLNEKHEKVILENYFCKEIVFCIKYDV